MNRHDRRAAAARRRRNRNRHDTLYCDYIQHLSQAPVDAPLEAGRVYHLCFHHDPQCEFYAHEHREDCTCNPAITRHVEPRRS
jgi:hypothetical protein